VQHEEGLGALRSILPDATDAKDAQILLLSFMVGAFMPDGSLPLLALSGRQGSGKSTQTRRLRRLIDPNQAPARQQPRTEDDLILAARNGALVAFDNLSRINQDMSDALCRLATGAGFSKRRLYSDSDEIIVQVRRPVVINGITDLVRMPISPIGRCLLNCRHAAHSHLRLTSSRHSNAINRACWYAL
jgi:energy-coupling factor transporter ATP-binding protein EcfA2